MGKPVVDHVASVAELIQSYGPSFGPWVMGLLTISIVVWVFAQFMKLYVKNIAASAQHMRDVVDTSETLRKSMMQEKQRCEEECRKKQDIIDMLVQQHSVARQTFLDAERERELAMRHLREELAEMENTVHVLTRELDKARTTKRSTDP